MDKKKERVRWTVTIDKDILKKFKNTCNDREVMIYEVTQNLMKNWVEREYVDKV